MKIDWKQTVDEEYFQKGRSFTVIAAALQPVFPELTRRQRYEKVRRYIRRKEAKLNSAPKNRSWKRDPKTGVEDWGGILEFPAGKQLTPEDVMVAWELKPSEWECVGFKMNIWQANAGEGKSMNLYQCEIKVKPVTAKNFTVEAAAEAIKNAEVHRAPARERINQSGMLATLEIVDLHFNKYASEYDSGEKYDPEVAVARFTKAVSDFVESVKDRKIPLERILFPIGGDYFNSDTMGGTTTGGTPQSNALRPQEAFSKGYSLVRWGVAQLASIAPVEVILTPGNHDTLTSYCMAFALDQYFSDDKNVAVDYFPAVRKYREFGVTGLCFAHGDKDRKRLIRCILAEGREIIGRTQHFEVHAQHLHEEGADASTGIMVRTISSLTGTDAWHHTNGYVGARKCAESFFYDRTEGLKHRMYHPG